MKEYIDIDLTKDLDIGFNFSDGFVVTYKGFPLWRTGEGLDKLTIRIYDPTKRRYSDDPDYYLLECVDSLGDCFYYGRFNDLDELEEFLNNPFAYHKKQERLMELLFGGVE